MSSYFSHKLLVVIGNLKGAWNFNSVLSLVVSEY